MGVWFSFTDERLISPIPAQFVGARNYARLLQVSILTVDPLVDPATSQPAAGQTRECAVPGYLHVYPGSQRYPQYFELEQWFSVDLGNHRYVVLAHDPNLPALHLQQYLLCAGGYSAANGIGIAPGTTGQSETEGAELFPYHLL